MWQLWHLRNLYLSNQVKTSPAKARHEKPAEPLSMGFCGLISKELPAVGIEPTLLAERDFESNYRVLMANDLR